MNLFTYYVEKAKAGIKSLRGDFEEQSTPLYKGYMQYSPTFQPELAAELGNIESLEGPEAQLIMDAALALTKKRPSQKELETIIKACPLISEYHPKCSNTNFHGEINELQSEAGHYLEFSHGVPSAVSQACAKFLNSPDSAVQTDSAEKMTFNRALGIVAVDAEDGSRLEKALLHSLRAILAISLEKTPEHEDLVPLRDLRGFINNIKSKDFHEQSPKLETSLAIIQDEGILPQLIQLEDMAARSFNGYDVQQEHAKDLSQAPLCEDDIDTLAQ